MKTIIWLSSYILPQLTARLALKIFLTPQKIKRPASEHEWYQNAKKYKLLGKYAAYEWGDVTQPLVMLVHGWAGRGTQMGAFAPQLVEAGYRVLAVDGPAHGQSIGQQTNAGDFARFLVEVQKQTGPLTCVIGHSFGAGCSVLAVKWGLETQKLVLIAGPSDYEKVISGFFTYFPLSKSAKHHFIEKLTSLAKVRPQELNIAQIGSEIKIPTLIIHDQDDREVGHESALEMHQAWPHSVLLSTQGLGHRRILKDAQVISRTVDFVIKS